MKGRRAEGNGHLKQGGKVIKSRWGKALKFRGKDHEKQKEKIMTRRRKYYEKQR